MSNNTNCSDEGEPHLEITPVCLYTLITIVGFMFNIIALVVFCKRDNYKSRSRTVIYMTNLALADMLLILTLPLRIFYHLGFKIDQWACNLLGLILKANMYSSIYFLTLMCCDRCLAVTLPMSSRVQEGRKKAVLFCIGVWMLTFGASVPIYLFTDVKGEEPQCHCFNSLPLIATHPKVIYPTLTLGFGMPMVLMLTCSWFLLRAIRRSTVARTDLVDTSKISKMIGVSLLIFLTSFLPYHVLLLLVSLNREDISDGLLTAYRYSLMVACFNTVLDPVAYYFTTDTFRRTVVGIIPLNSQSSDLRRGSRAQDS